MSRHSSTNNELFYVTLRTSYADDYGYERSREILWRAFGWEGSIDIDKRTKWWDMRYRFTVNHFPFDPEDNEQMYLHFERR